MAVTINASTSSGLVQSADTSGQIDLQSNGTTKLSVLSTGVSGTLIQGTAVTTTSGLTADFTNIPSWVKKITVSFADISFAAAGTARLRLGTSGGLVASGYTTVSTSLSSTPAISLGSITDGIGGLTTSGAATVVTGQFTLVNITGNTWQSSGFISRLADNSTIMYTGYIGLSGTLTQLSLVATTSTFDAGTINIQYEG